jgi:ribosomal-protein-alanine N-acetyltransferase
MTPRLLTPRLEIVACTAQVALSVLGNRTQAEKLSGFTLDPAWPEADMPPVLQSYARALGRAPKLLGFGVWLIAHNGSVIGDGGFKGPPKAGRVEIGYSIVPAFRSRGFATEAVRALCAWAFGQGVVEILAETGAGNAASGRVLERCGFSRANKEGAQWWSLPAAGK